MTTPPSQPARLHILTFNQHDLPTGECDGTYTCTSCLRCQHDRWERQRQGVRPTQGLPVKTALRKAA